jgi:hypothetical protein
MQRYGRHGTIGAIAQIVVIESLPEHDKKTGRLLREDLEPIALQYGSSLQIHFKFARDAEEFEFLLRELCAYVELSGRAPCLHIECHGNRDGLGLADGSWFPWSRLKPLTTALNLASRMNLFLVLACCYGGFFAAECRPDETAPFAWIMGLGREMYPDSLFAFTGAFYAELLRTRDVTEALTVSGGAAADISYFSMSAVGIFRLALEARIRGGDSITRYRERAEAIAHTLHDNGHPSPPSVTEVEATLRGLEPSIFSQWRRRFFALDRFSANESRFAVSYEEVLSQVIPEQTDRGISPQ